MKKILIVNANSMLTNNATGITLRSMFQKYGIDNVMELFWAGEPQHTIQGLISMRASVEYPLYVRVFGKLRRSKMNNTIKSNEMNTTVQRDKGQSSWLMSIRQWIALRSEYGKVIINKQICEAIEKFHPEVIYTLGGNLGSLKYAYQISQKYNLPIVLHHMDNWMNSIQWDDNPLLGTYKKDLQKYCRLCLKRSSHSLAISPLMACEYHKQTGVAYDFLMNTIDVDQYYTGPCVFHNPIRILYAGGLHLGRITSMMEIIESLSKLNSNSNKAVLDVYTNQEGIILYGDILKKYKFVRIHQAVSHDKIVEIYKEHDVLVHMESTNLIGNTFFKYSISTKIPEYLSSGKVVLFYGPKDIYLSEFLQENKAALVANSQVDLDEVLSNLSYYNVNVDKLTRRSREVAKQFFDSSTGLKRFINTIDSAKIPD